MSDLPTVAPVSEMDKDLFAKHFNSRHHSSLAGLGEIVPYDEYTLNLYRALHGRIHSGKAGDAEINHDHRSGRPDQAWQDGTPREQETTQ